jgi:hypothetical protein
MSLDDLLEEELAEIKAALASVPPKIVEAQNLVESFARKVRNRKTSVPRVFKIDELKKAVEHLSFDMHHFRCFSKLDKNEDLERFSGAAHQAVRYALLLHLRVLVDFFYKPAQFDDCNVEHFNVLDGFAAAFPGNAHLATAGVRKMSTDLNKLLAHMTATRWEKPRPPMDKYDEFIPIIDDQITRFEAALPEDVRQVFLTHYRMWEAWHPATVSRQ